MKMFENKDDLHLCDTETPKLSEKSIDLICQCPPEYYCVEFCGEATLESISSLISWQHFPRSTSTRSRCDTSSDDVRIKRSISSSTIEVVETKEEKPSETISSTEYPITKTKSQLNALHYLQIRHVYDLINFLIGHLVCNEPDDPIQFLEDLLDKCIKYRDSFGEPPLLFTHHHIKSLYKAFDPFERNQITLQQYEEGMTYLGVTNGPTPYNKEPQGPDGVIGEKEFVFEAERCLIQNLDKMFRIPQPWEENRLKWKMKMKHENLKQFKKSEQNLRSTTEISKPYRKFCTCAGPDNIQKVICDCAPKSEVVHEPKQLFLEDFTC